MEGMVAKWYAANTAETMSQYVLRELSCFSPFLEFVIPCSVCALKPSFLRAQFG